MNIFSSYAKEDVIEYKGSRMHYYGMRHDGKAYFFCNDGIHIGTGVPIQFHREPMPYPDPADPKFNPEEWAKSVARQYYTRLE